MFLITSLLQNKLNKSSNVHVKQPKNNFFAVTRLIINQFGPKMAYRPTEARAPPHVATISLHNSASIQCLCIVKLILLIHKFCITNLRVVAIKPIPIISLFKDHLKVRLSDYQFITTSNKHHMHIPTLVYTTWQIIYLPQTHLIIQFWPFYSALDSNKFISIPNTRSCRCNYNV